jgi:hypothetical protein
VTLKRRYQRGASAHHAEISRTTVSSSLARDWQRVANDLSDATAQVIQREKTRYRDNSPTKIDERNQNPRELGRVLTAEINA